MFSYNQEQRSGSFSFATNVLCDYILILKIIHCPISVYMHMYSYDYASYNLLENWIILKHWNIYIYIFYQISNQIQVYLLSGISSLAIKIFQYIVALWLGFNLTF